MKKRIRNEIELGGAIKAVRLSQGLTQAELADRAQVSRAFIIGIERGTGHRSELGRVLRVVRALGRSITLGEDDTPDFKEALAGLISGDRDGGG
jgi:transcriptional regulator with XRE-family HTH domain